MNRGGAAVIYVAADFVRGAEANALAICLTTAGAKIVSSWHSTAHGAEMASARTVGGPPKADALVAAKRNLRELDAANTVVVLTTGELARGGRHFETGYAHALKKRVILVGVVEHAFHHLDGIEVVPDADSVVDLLSH